MSKQTAVTYSAAASTEGRKGQERRTLDAGWLGGALLLGLGAAAWEWVRRQERATTREAAVATTAPPEDPLTTRLAAHVRTNNRRLHDRIAALGAGCALVGLLLLLTPLIAPQLRAGEVAMPMPNGAASSDERLMRNSAPPFPTNTTPTISSDSPEPAKPGNSSGSLLTTTLAFVAAGGLALIVGALLLGFSPGIWAKAVGTAMVTFGLTAHGYLVKEVKFGDLFKFDTRIDKASLELDFRKQMAELAQFGPEQLASFDDFESGRADIRPHMKDALDAACARWKAQGGRDQRGVLLVIGSTDRTRLTATISRQYESNVGLARARAEQVRIRLVEQCDVPPSQLVTLVSGPRYTPAEATAVAAEDAAKDRSVALWAMWSVPRK